MLISDIKRVIEQVSRDKGIGADVLIRTLEEALKSAAKKKFGNNIDIEVKYNEDSGEIEVFQFREVVEEVSDPDIEINLEAGLQLDPECEIGDWLGSKIDTESFGRKSRMRSGTRSTPTSSTGRGRSSTASFSVWTVARSSSTSVRPRRSSQPGSRSPGRSTGGETGFGHTSWTSETTATDHRSSSPGPIRTSW
jgi:hypothetical protein